MCDFNNIFYQKILEKFVREKKLLLKEKQAEINSNIIHEDNAARANKLLQYKYISTKQHKISLV